MDAQLCFLLPGKRLHLGVCGSVAAYRALDLVRLWQDAGLTVSVTLTPSALRFVTALPFEALGAAPVYTSMFEDARAPSPFAHLEPGQVAQAMVVAPASAATLARLAQGQADEVLACQALAFEGPLVVAPAMNPKMWNHPATRANVDVLRQRGCVVVSPGWGRTACGEEGQGRLADLRLVYLAGLKALAPQDMAGMKVMVTLGPTRESFDGVRFWSNASTGVMGAALAVAAWLRGAHVYAVCGPGCPWLPENAPKQNGIFQEATLQGYSSLTRYNVTSAREMLDAAIAVWPDMDMGLFTAAVADFSPLGSGQGKFKKHDAPDGFDLHFGVNPDILKTLAGSRRLMLPNQGDQLGRQPQKVMGFAAEAVDLEQAVRRKLQDKKADMVVGNLIQDGFGTTTNSVFVADAAGREEHWSQVPKASLAWRLLSWLLSR